MCRMSHKTPHASSLVWNVTGNSWCIFELKTPKSNIEDLYTIIRRAPELYEYDLVYWCDNRNLAVEIECRLALQTAY